MTEQKRSEGLSRRSVLQSAACAAGAAAGLSVAARNALAQTKAKQQAVDYQNTPKGDQQCSNCMQFETPASCKVVEGSISPQGWCKIWVKKS